MTDEYDGDGKTAWYEDNNVEIFLNDKAVAIDTDAIFGIGSPDFSTMFTLNS